MPKSKPMATKSKTTDPEILTVPEAASFLRVSESQLLTDAIANKVPGQQIGSEWRFLKQGLAEWVHRGTNGAVPHPEMELSLLTDRIRVLESRILAMESTPQEKSPKPGSKEAIRKAIGVFRDDPTLDDMLADIYARRKEQTFEDDK